MCTKKGGKLSFHSCRQSGGTIRVTEHEKAKKAQIASKGELPQAQKEREKDNNPHLHSGGGTESL